MSIFLRSSMCFRVPHLCSKIPKINNWWIVVYTVCASAVISPLRQWLDSYAKTRLKMCHPFKQLFIINTFCCRLILLSLSLYIELALVCCTNPNNVNFWDYIPESKLCFCVNLSRPPGTYWIRPIQKLLNCQTRTRCRCYSIHPDWGSKQEKRCGSGFAK